MDIAEFQAGSLLVSSSKNANASSDNQVCS